MGDIKKISGTTTETSLSRAKEVSCRVTNSILKYMDSIGYDTAHLISGLPYSKQYLINPFNWISYSLREQICNQATKLSNDESIMYQVGLAIPKLKPLGGFEQLVGLLGSPKLAYKSIPKYTRFFDKTFQFKVDVIGDDRAIVTASIPKEYSASVHACYYTQGILAAIPTLWGYPAAEVRETQCMCQPSEGLLDQQKSYGADSCQYEVAWQPVESRFKKPFGKLQTPNWIPEAAIELENHFLLLEGKNAELLQRNTELARIREMALGVDSVRTVDDVYQLVVESARDIPGVRFVIIQQLDESGQYLTTPYYSKLRSAPIRKALRSMGFDLDKQLGKKPTSRKLQLPIAKMRVAQDYIANRRIIVEERLSEILDGTWPAKLCDTIQNVVGVKKFVIVPVAAEGQKDTVLVFFLDGEIHQDVLEMVAAHCATAINNMSMLETQEKTLQSLAESQEMLHLILESIVEGITVTDLEANITQVNESVLRMHRYTNKEELIDKSALKLIVEKDRARAMANMQRTLKDGYGGTIEYTFRRRDGSAFPAELSAAAIRDASGRTTGFVTTTRDMTERKREEEKLRNSEEQYRLISENTSDVITIITFDLNPVFEYVSPSIKAYGYEPEELIGKHCFDIIHLDDKKQLISLLKQYISAKAQGLLTGRESPIVETIEFRARGKSGNWYDLRSTTNLVGNKILIINRDVTQRKRSEEELKELYEQEKVVRDKLEVEMEKRIQLAAALVHELKTPLTAIVSSSSLLSEKAKEEMSQRLANNIHRSSSVLDKRVSELLDLASGEVGMLQLTLKPVNFLQFMDSVREETKALVLSKKLSLHTELPPNFSTFLADEDRLRQVLLNLLVNAIKYSKEGETITLRARQDNADLIVEVEDTGIGLTDEEQRHVFEPYRRLIDGNRPTGGVGLGLAISKNLVELHNGKIWVNSQKGVGSTFSFSIPLKAANKGK